MKKLLKLTTILFIVISCKTGIYSQIIYPDYPGYLDIDSSKVDTVSWNEDGDKDGVDIFFNGTTWTIDAPEVYKPDTTTKTIEVGDESDKGDIDLGSTGARWVLDTKPVIMVVCDTATHTKTWDKGIRYSEYDCEKGEYVEREIKPKRWPTYPYPYWIKGYVVRYVHPYEPECTYLDEYRKPIIDKIILYARRLD